MSDIAHIPPFNEKLPLDKCILEIEKYGNPRISKQQSGWVAMVEVFVTGEGIEFEVKSEFGHKSPIEASNECYQRLIKAVNQIKNGDR